MGGGVQRDRCIIILTRVSLCVVKMERKGSKYWGIMFSVIIVENRRSIKKVRLKWSCNVIRLQHYREGTHGHFVKSEIKQKRVKI